jgi:hypothetical protein
MLAQGAASNASKPWDATPMSTTPGRATEHTAKVSVAPPGLRLLCLADPGLRFAFGVRSTPG